jgi:ribosomal protein L25 (general stress protein Ctc)
MGKALRIEIDGRTMSLKEALRHLVASGRDNAAIRRMVGGQTSGKHLAVEIARARRELANGERRQQINIHIDERSKQVFDRQAAARGVSTGRLLREMARIIAEGDMFDAVLDGELPVKQEGAAS